MKTRALFTAALLGTAVLFSACGSKTETNELPAADSTATPATPSAAPVTPAPTTPPPAVDTTVSKHTDTVITKTDTSKKM